MADTPDRPDGGDGGYGSTVDPLGHAFAAGSAVAIPDPVTVVVLPSVPGAGRVHADRRPRGSTGIGHAGPRIDPTAPDRSGTRDRQVDPTHAGIPCDVVRHERPARRADREHGAGTAVGRRPIETPGADDRRDDADG